MQAGLIIAAAALTANLAVVLTAMAARREPRDDALRLTLLTRLLRRKLWWAAAGLDLGGAVLKTAALLVAPLTVVAPAMTLGLFVLVVFAAIWLGERPKPTGVFGIALIAGGVALVAQNAPEREVTIAGPLPWAISVGVLLGGGASVYLLSASGRRVDPRLIAVSVGFAWALNGLLAKLIADSIDVGRWLLLSVAIVSAIGVGALGYLAKTSALQSGRAAMVESIVAVMNTLIPVALAPILFAEAWPTDPGSAIQLGSGLLLVGGGVWFVTRVQTTTLERAKAEVEVAKA